MENFGGKSLGKQPAGRLTIRSEGNIKMDFNKIGCEY